MRLLLPSQRKAAIEAAIVEYKRSGELDICEPCNCECQIRHNNGGNYHERVYLRRDEGKDFIAFDSTYEDSQRSDWEEVQNVRKVIEQYADWL